jgi:hypothetical protein
MKKKTAKAKEKEKEVINLKQSELQKRYDDECRKLNAARSMPEASKSVEAIRLCSTNIVAIKKEAKEEEIILNICSDESFGTDEPHVHITKDGRSIFVCGDVRFEMDIHDINKAIGTNGEESPLHKLMDSQIMELARSIGLQIEPFVRELIEVPLTGLLQLCWYRDIEKHESDHLKDNQHKRVEKYHNALAHYDANAAENNSPDSPRRANKTRTSSKITIPVDQHKKLLEMHKKGQTTGAIAIALGMERNKASRSAIRNALHALSGQKSS